MGLKKTRKNSDTIGFFIMLFFFIGIPLFMIKVFVAANSSRETESLVQEDVDNVEDVLTSIKERALSASSSSYGKTCLLESDGMYALEGPITDAAKLLDQETYSYLENFLVLLSNETSVQVALLTLEELSGKDIASLALSYAEKWKLGSSKQDNGVLLTIALKEHQVRIDTGYGSEGALTDAKCARIIRNVIVPAFRAGSYSAGIREAVENIAGIICNDPSLVTIRQSEGETSIETLPFVIFMLFWGFFIFIVILGLVRGGKSRRGPSGTSYVRPMGSSFSNSHSHSHSSSSSSSGYRGGGGSFGGGGASGSW